MAFLRIAEIGEMTVDLDVNVSDQATSFVVTHTRRARPEIIFFAKDARPEFKPRMEADKPSTVTFPVRFQLTRETVVNRQGIFLNQLILPPFAFTEHE